MTTDTRLSDEVLAELLADCERRLDHWRKHGAQVEDDPGVGCETVAAIVREVQAARRGVGEPLTPEEQRQRDANGTGPQR